MTEAVLGVNYQKIAVAKVSGVEHIHRNIDDTVEEARVWVYHCNHSIITVTYPRTTSYIIIRRQAIVIVSVNSTTPLSVVDKSQMTGYPTGYCG